MQSWIAHAGFTNWTARMFVLWSSIYDFHDFGLQCHRWVTQSLQPLQPSSAISVKHEVARRVFCSLYCRQIKVILWQFRANPKRLNRDPTTRLLKYLIVSRIKLFVDLVVYAEFTRYTLTAALNFKFHRTFFKKIIIPLNASEKSSHTDILVANPIMHKVIFNICYISRRLTLHTGSHFY